MTVWHVTSTDERGENKTVTRVEVTRVGSVYTSNLEPKMMCSCEDEAALFPLLIKFRVPSSVVLGDGTSPCVVRVRYTYGGKVSLGPSVTLGAIRWEKLGWRMDGGSALSETYQVILNHLREIQMEKSAQIADIERKMASSASYRATLAIMKIFGLRCIRKHVKVRASETTAILVEISLSGGPWLPVDGNGDVIE